MVAARLVALSAVVESLQLLYGTHGGTTTRFHQSAAPSFNLLVHHQLIETGGRRRRSPDLHGFLGANDVQDALLLPICISTFSLFTFLHFNSSVILHFTLLSSSSLHCCCFKLHVYKFLQLQISMISHFYNFTFYNFTFLSFDIIIWRSLLLYHFTFLQFLTLTIATLLQTMYIPF